MCERLPWEAGPCRGHCAGLARVVGIAGNPAEKVVLPDHHGATADRSSRGVETFAGPPQKG